VKLLLCLPPNIPSSSKAKGQDIWVIRDVLFGPVACDFKLLGQILLKGILKG